LYYFQLVITVETLSLFKLISDCKDTMKSSYFKGFALHLLIQKLTLVILLKVTPFSKVDI